MAKKLQGKVAVITGGSCGIGLATAKLFIEHGAHVYITGRRQTELDKALKFLGSGASAVQGDVASLNDLDSLFNVIRAERGVLHVVVANAGMVETMPTEKITTEHFDKTFNLNARGTFFTVQKALPLMTQGGSIVIVAGTVHHKGIPGYATYAACKAAQRSLSRTWAAEFKDRKIRVNTLSPGPVDTAILDNLFATKAEADTGKSMFAKMTAFGRLGRTEEIAAAALFLASDDSSFSTGIELVADGGITQL